MTSLPDWSRALAALATLFVATAAIGCGSGRELYVDLKTDYAPGIEFDEVRVELAREPTLDARTLDQVRVAPVRVGPDDRRFVDGLRVADFSGLDEGDWWVRLVLLKGSSVVAERPLLVTVSGRTATTIVIDRACGDVECPGSGPPALLACLAGQCVDPRCSPEAPEFCPPLTCDTDADCAPSDVPCAAVECAAGTCFVWSMSSRCGEGYVCDPDIGCVQDEALPRPDGGALGDAGPTSCELEYCDLGDACQVGALSCDGARLCNPVANVRAGTACSLGECDGAGACVGYLLSVVADAAHGSILSDPGGISCGAGLDTCAARFDAGTAVTLHASPATGYVMTGWTGACAGTPITDDCVVTMSGPLNVGATFELAMYRLQVAAGGSGAGRVTGGVAIDCTAPMTCAESFTHGSAVELVAAPEAGSLAVFDGCDSTSADRCMLTMTADRTVRVTFVSSTLDSLTIVRNGTGSGAVRGGSVDCGTLCSIGGGARPPVLTAYPDPGSYFVGWTGAGCSGTGTCVPSFSGPVTLFARFDRIRHSVRVTKSGAGTGTVSGAGISCGATCTATVDEGYTCFTASPSADSLVSAWSVTCEEGGSVLGDCCVTVTSTTVIDVTFSRRPVSITVGRDGPGTGTVVSTPAGINCGSTCSALFPYAGMVTLTATPAAGSAFSMWTGAPGCTTSPTCVVTPTAAMSVRATFGLVYPVTVRVTGEGDVVGEAGLSAIDCPGSACTANVAAGTYTLRATPRAGSVFVGWTGCTSIPTPMACTIDVSAGVLVEAMFAVVADDARVIVEPMPANGRVVSVPPGISCPGTCDAMFPAGTEVALIPVADDAYVFSGWSGGCPPGTSHCSRALVAGEVFTLSARFDRAPVDACTLTVRLLNAAPGERVISQQHAGIWCNAVRCTMLFPCSDRLDLFSRGRTPGWAGCDSMVGDMCSLGYPPSIDRTVTVDFAGGP